MPPLVMSNRLAGDFIDPLGTMITRIVDGLTERSAERLAAGGILEGEGFRLSRMELAVSNGRKTLHLPFAEIDYLAALENNFCVWRRGDERPLIKIAPGAKNAHVLTALLTRWVEHGSAKTANTEFAGSTGMGRLLFWRNSKSVNWLFMLACIVLGVLGVVGVSQRGNFAAYITLLVAVLLALLAFVATGNILECYERGVRRRRGGNTVQLTLRKSATSTTEALKRAKQRPTSASSCDLVATSGSR